MKLSELVHFRAQLQAHSALQIARVANAELDKIQYTINSQSFQIGQHCQLLEDQRKNIEQTFADYDMQRYSWQNQLGSKKVIDYTKKKCCTKLPSMSLIDVCQQHQRLA
jgi:hypothetical protein